MNKLLRLFVPSKVVLQFNSLIRTSVAVNKGNSPSCCEYNITTIGMAQRSITSFFKSTPKKSDDKTSDTSLCDEDSATNQSKCFKTKVDIEPNTTKRSSKRLRSNSVEDEKTDKSRSASPVTPAAKKKVKRQRIESSGSEGSPPPVSSPISPRSPEQDGIFGKQESENKSLKTYNSPKSRKLKAKAEKSPLAQKNTIKEEKSPVKDECKMEKLSPKQAKTESPAGNKKKATIKQSKSPTVKKEIVEDESNKVAVNGDGVVPENEYNPAKSKYHPIKDACWTKGQEVPYLALAKTFETIEAISARLKIVEILSNYFRSVIALTPEDLLPSIYLCLNQLAPAYHSLELGIAETYLMKAVGQCTGRSVAQVRAAARREGDLGAAARLARSTQRTLVAPPPLTARNVLAKLREIARMTGQASVNKKISIIQSLYVACRHSEAKYLIRSLEGKLRIGLAEQSVLQALAQACAATPPPAPPPPPAHLVLDAAAGLSQEQFKAKVDSTAFIIKSTYCECPNYELIIPVLLSEGVEMLPKRCTLTPGIPLKPMLAHPTKGVHEVFNRFEKEQFTCEYKYDGERAQLHVPATQDLRPDLGHARIFSRNQEDNTSKYPDILARLPSLLKESVQSCVLDCEAVAYDTLHKQILPFQVLSTRKRKDAVSADIKVQVCVFVFDLLYINGRPLVNEPFLERRRLLREHFNTKEGEWQFAVSKDCSSTEEVQAFLEEAVRGSCEGLMVKTLLGASAKYDIARRSHNWLKLKKDYLEGVGDTLDVVVIGGYLGKGKRAGAYGGFLLACYDPDLEEYQSICKIGTGFSDEDLQTLSADLNEHLIDAPKSYYRFDASHVPDAWFLPARVWEVRAADLSLSPAHRAAQGLVQGDKGVSLRFPRFVRVRDDKSPEQATSARQVADMYLAQDQVRNQHAPAHNDDFY